jgi:hypothetical protein
MSEQFANDLLFGDPSIDDAGLSTRAFRVLYHLAIRADNNRDACSSITAMAKTCRMRRNTVIREIWELERSGHLSTEKLNGRSTTYHVFWPPKSAKETMM